MTTSFDLSALDKLTDTERAELDQLLALPPDVAYQRDPVGWMRDVLQVPEWSLRWSLLSEYEGHQWDGTKDPLAAMCEAIAAGKDVGVESGTGTGKTFAAGGLVLWFNACFEDSLAVTMAPVEKQLKAQLWKEIGQHWSRYQARYPMASMVDLRVRMREGAGEQERWAVIGYGVGLDAGAQSATRAQGFHAPHMLIVTEETPGMDKAVMTANANTSTGDHNLQLALGNPDHQLDELHQFCLRPGVVHIRISALDHPNVVCGREVIPGAVGQKSVRERLITANNNRDDPMFMSRVRGISPAEATDALIRLAWCEVSAARWSRRVLTREDRPAFGVDVAQSEAGDKAAVAEGRGNWLKGVRAFPCKNATALGRDVAMEAKEAGAMPGHVGVDSVGIGAATANALYEELGNIEALNGGASPVGGAQKAADGMTRDWLSDANEFTNLRSQMWWQLREDLRMNAVELPNNPELFRQLVMPTFKRQGRAVIVESKDQVRKRLGRSPDDADAVVYWNWVRPRRVIAKAGISPDPDRHPGWDTETKGRKQNPDGWNGTGRPTAPLIHKPSFRRSE